MALETVSKTMSNGEHRLRTEVHVSDNGRMRTEFHDSVGPDACGARDARSVADVSTTDGGVNPGTVAPKQARSRRTLDRLLDAAEGALAESGLEGATVPVIAARAGLSVGVVYRRFHDKDALLRATYERFFARALEGNRAALAAERWAGVGAGAVIGAVVAGIVRGHILHRALLRALFAYAESHRDPAFRRRVAALNAAAAAQVAALLEARAAGIRTHRIEKLRSTASVVGDVNLSSQSMLAV
jgi:AcrR family transcriptional regulator